MKVLLVEDDPSIREGMTELVGELAEVRAVGSVAEALAALSGAVFDLVVTDLRIGGDRQGGRRIVEAARRYLAPVMIVSGMSREEILAELKDNPPDAVLTKPFQLEDVLSLTERFLTRRREADRYATLRNELRDAEFQPVHPGFKVAVVPHTDDREVRWFRLEPGAVVDRISQKAALTVIVEGAIEVEGARQVIAGESLFSAAGSTVRVSSRDGAAGVILVFDR